MNIIRIACVLLSGFATVASAQSINASANASAGGSAKPKETDADREMTALRVAARPVAVATSDKMTPAEFKKVQEMQSSAFAVAAQQAHDFYSKHPDDARAPEAKKIEVLSLLRAVNTGSEASEPQALRLAKEFRAESKHQAHDRYEVAMAMVQREAIKRNIVDRTEFVKFYHQRARDLLGEFPTEKGVYELFLGVAQNSDDATAKSVATELLTLPAPDEVKKSARSLIDRLAMPGKAINFEWQDEAGDSHQVSDYAGSIVVFYVWAGWAQPDGIVDAQIVPASVPGIQIVSVNVDTDVPAGKKLKAKSALKGADYFDARGLRSPLPQQLHATRVPAVHVVNAKGVYVGSGAPEQLATLLAAAAE